jgi:hypothetical protein
MWRGGTGFDEERDGMWRGEGRDVDGGGRDVAGRGTGCGGGRDGMWRGEGGMVRDRRGRTVDDTLLVIQTPGFFWHRCG